MHHYVSLQSLLEDSLHAVQVRPRFPAAVPGRFAEAAREQHQLLTPPKRGEFAHKVDGVPKKTGDSRRVFLFHELLLEGIDLGGLLVGTGSAGRQRPVAAGKAEGIEAGSVRDALSFEGERGSFSIRREVGQDPKAVASPHGDRHQVSRRQLLSDELRCRGAPPKGPCGWRELQVEEKQKLSRPFSLDRDRQTGDLALRGHGDRNIDVDRLEGDDGDSPPAVLDFEVLGLETAHGPAILVGDEDRNGHHGHVGPEHRRFWGLRRLGRGPVLAQAAGRQEKETDAETVPRAQCRFLLAG